MNKSPNFFENFYLSTAKRVKMFVGDAVIELTACSARSFRVQTESQICKYSLNFYCF